MSVNVQATGPHIESPDTVKQKMWEVSGALLPAVIAAGIFFGPYALYLIFASAIASALLERPFVAGGFSWKQPFGDGSAFLAGLLFGLTLSPGSPWWIPLFGAVLVIFVGKLAFGGIGNNIFNPALVARGILLIAYPALVTEWRLPMNYDAVASATPLEGYSATYLEIFLGTIPGSVGEVSAIALIIGAVYLLVRGFVGWRISLSFLGSAMLTALALGIDPIFTILSGSIMFAALFMATDMVTSPVGRSARIIYGIGCGVLTVLIRHFTVYPAGVTFAILIMNGATPMIDAKVVDAFFGEVEKRRRRIVALAGAAAVVVIGIAATSGAASADIFYADYFVDGTTRRDIRLFFPEAHAAMAMDLPNSAVRGEQVYRGTEPVGYLVYSQAQGYKSTIRLVTALDLNERIIGMRVLEHNESATLGGLIRRPSFLNQFLRQSSANPDAVVNDLQAITGATVSSRAVALAVEQALLFQTEPDSGVPALQLGADGTYAGTARGYGGEIQVAVTVAGGRITEIDVVAHQETPGLGEPALFHVAGEIIQAQSLDVDNVSSATSSARGIVSAVANALGQ